MLANPARTWPWTPPLSPQPQTRRRRPAMAGAPSRSYAYDLAGEGHFAIGGGPGSGWSAWRWALHCSARKSSRSRTDGSSPRRDGNTACTRPAGRSPLRQHVDQGAGGEVGSDHHRRQLHDADAGERRLAQRRHVVGDEARPMRDRAEAPSGPSRLHWCSRRGGAKSRLGMPARSAGDTRRAGISSRRRRPGTGCLGERTHDEIAASSGGERTRIARSKPSATTSTRRLVLSRCTSTRGCATMKRRSSRRTGRRAAPTGSSAARCRAARTRTARCLLGRLGLDQHRDAVVVVLWPISVTAKRRVERWIRRTPSRSSSSAMRRLSRDFGMPSARAGRREAAVVDHLDEVIEVVEVLASFYR